MKVLAFIDYYEPGYRWGGPIRSLVAMTANLVDQIDYWVYTRSTEMGESTPLPGIEPDTWNVRSGAKVYYSSTPLASFGQMRRVIAQSQPNVLYFNSFFSPTTVAALVGMRLGLLPKMPILMAPRGEFSRGALQLKSRKKSAYIAASRLLRLHKDISWHVSTSAEADDLRRVIPEAQNIYSAPDLLLPFGGDYTGLPQKLPGRARFVFIARISPKKNLLGAINYLQSQRGDLDFDIYGPLEDRSYWEECLDAASRLPPNVRFSYRGELAHSEVATTLGQYHFLLFPTLGENFGHSIAEALCQGLPVLLSDQTPWRNLERMQVGWDIGLDDAQKWQQVIEACVQMDNESYQAMSIKCRGFTEQWLSEQGGVQANLDMFLAVAASPPAM